MTTTTRGESTQLAEALVEVSPDAMVLVDRYGTIVLVNSQTERLFGYARAELLGQPVDTALRLAQEARPDVAVLDIGLPGIDGYELGRRLRALPGLAHLPLVALTGYGREPDRQRSRDAGFDAHLAKPVEPSLIAETVRALTRARRIRQ